MVKRRTTATNRAVRYLRRKSKEYYIKVETGTYLGERKVKRMARKVSQEDINAFPPGGERTRYQDRDKKAKKKRKSNEKRLR